MRDEPKSMTGKNRNIPLSHGRPQQYHESAVIAELVDGGYIVIDGDNDVAYVDEKTGEWDFCQVRDDIRAWIEDDSQTCE